MLHTTYIGCLVYTVSIIINFPPPPPPPPHYLIGVDYIPFLDLDAQDGVEIQLVTPVESFIFASREYFSDPIFVNTGIPIGGAGEVATRLYVSYRYSVTKGTEITCTLNPAIP